MLLIVAGTESTGQLLQWVLLRHTGSVASVFQAEVVEFCGLGRADPATAACCWMVTNWAYTA
ncbi:hypothetical protein B1987_22590 [Mycobacterium kansasii]|uniref:hypothetical protein n=1 Tax=Mycobacterium attenuatum TaxID=2341086 RepID=UPI000A0A8A36|nr:hypothetical protein [Mycobacterium attenuatum]ORB86095.1 hypothetical protein B1987_22590 [Mycobacterium kansasii]